MKTMLSQAEAPAAVLRLLGLPHRTEPIPGRVPFVICQWICGCSMVEHGGPPSTALWSACNTHQGRA